MLCLLVSLGIYESQVTVMFFDKSVDVTAFVLATFLASLLAPVVALALHPRRALAMTTVVLGLATAAAALGRDANLELAASTVGTVFGMWWLAFFATIDTGGERVRTLSMSAPAALGLLVVARAVGGTRPLDELAFFFAAPLVAVLLAALAWGGASVAPRVEGWKTTDSRGALSLFALPFAFALCSDVALNGAVVAGSAGLGLRSDGPSSTLVGLLAAGTGVALALLADGRWPARPPFVVVAILAGAVLLWGRSGVWGLLGGALLAFGLVTATSLFLGAPQRPARVPVLPTIALGFGWLASIVASLFYYIGVGLVVALVSMVLVACIAAALTRPALAPWGGRLTALIAALAILAPLATIGFAPEAKSVTPSGQLRVMTYNIHLGYDDGDVPAIEAIASVIAAEAPDLVALEEVTRGTVIAGGHDTLALLAERLGMSYAFAPMLGDVEGLAILSRIPIDDVRIIRLSRSTRKADLSRAALVVRAGGLAFVATHLGGDDFVTQVGSIIDGVRGADRVIIAGDLNSTPDSPQMRLFAQAGFTDVGAAANALTSPAGDPVDRIDYLWALGVDVRGVRTIRTTASDHLPVVADVTVR